MDIGLVLQGGGALGAYEWGAINRLIEVGMRPVAVSGVSIGAINAAVIAGAPHGDIRANLNELWTSISLPDMPLLPRQVQADMALFGNPSFFLPRRDYWTMASWKSFYSVAPMYDTLNRLVDWDRLNDPTITKVSVAATRLEDGRAVRFRNLDTELDARHILASGSLPPGFPMTEIDGSHYVDGGIFSNTPIPGLLGLLDDEQLDSLQIFVISLFPREDVVPKNILEMENRVKELTYENRIEAEYGGVVGMHEYGEMARQLHERFKDDPKFADNRAAHRLGRQRALAHLHVIEAPHAPTSGDRDFSEPSIKSRRQVGYDAAQGWLEVHREQLSKEIVKNID
ncbi:MAG: patatin-like phospholipase family protein [Pseudomonadota bacterium]